MKEIVLDLFVFEPGVGNFEDGDFDVNCTIKQINAVCIN